MTLKITHFGAKRLVLHPMTITFLTVCHLWKGQVRPISTAYGHASLTQLYFSHACFFCLSLLYHALPFNSNQCLAMYSETSLDRPPMGLIYWSIQGCCRFSEFRIQLWAVIWYSNKAIDIGEWSICGGGRFGRFSCMFLFIYIYFFQLCLMCSIVCNYG